MKKYFSLLTALLLFTMVVLSSCDNNKAGEVFNNKEDSVQFAKIVIDKYPDSFLKMGDTSTLPTKGKGVQPIPWDTVLAYKDYYDKDPKLFNLQNEAYKGFTIDPAGYSRIMKNARVKGIYLRLGRKVNGEYTIMLLGTDGNGNIISQEELPGQQREVYNPKDTTDYDRLEPCPTNCPPIEN